VKGDLKDLVRHALNALRGTSGDNAELNSKNTAVSIVGKDHELTIYEDKDVEQWLALLEEEKKEEKKDEKKDDKEGQKDKMETDSI
jgi:vesicle coat complex subunit